jgi:colanic acid/amylovoran biosynthesis glycosyltransferase
LKIAYLISRYPAVSHTFILREIQALRARGVEIDTFSVRRASKADMLGPEAEAEGKRTRWLVPPNIPQYLLAIAWALITRPLRTLSALKEAIGAFDISPIQRAMWLFYFLEAVTLARWLVRGHYTHLHCHFGNNGSNTAMLASMISAIPFSFTLHGIDLEPVEKFRLPRKLALAKFTVCISKRGKARMMQLCRADRWSSIRVVRCGLPLEDRPAPPCTDQHRLLCVARLSEEKGHLLLLEALKLLADEGTNFTCTLAGDGPLRGALEAGCQQLGLKDKVIFKGALSPAEVTECYKACDVVVLPSFNEGIPLVLMEALSMGRPVVSTHVGGIPELVENGVNGVLVAPGSARDLAEGLRKIFSDPERARAMGQAGVETVRTRYRIDIAAERLEKLFRGETLS